MHSKIPHTLTIPAAKKKIIDVLKKARPELAGKAEIEEERWDGTILHFAFSAQGHHISGTVDVTESAYVIDVKLPLVLKLFESRIEKMIQKQAGTMLR